MTIVFPKLVYAAAILCQSQGGSTVIEHTRTMKCRTEVTHCAQKLATDYTEDKRAKMNRGHQMIHVHDDPKTLPEFYVEQCFEKVK